jgi:ribonucleoside-diphosphate reductase beta chain
MEPIKPTTPAPPAAQKTLLNASGTDPNKILPIKYNWARAHYKKGVANNWTPEEVPMQDDIELWKKPGGLSDGERRLILWNMGFFSTAESLTANNIVLAVYRHLTNPECRQYLLRQAYEEAIHTDTFIYCCDSLGLNPDEVYTMYQTIPNIAAKDDFVVDMTKNIFDEHFKVDSPENIQRYVHDLIGYYVIMEGIFFYAGFVMMLSFKRQNRMIGTGEQFQYILRDESVHLAFGSDLINSIVDENPSVWTPEFQKKITENIVKAVDLEHDYAKGCLPEPLLGLNEQLIRQYLEYIADRRLERIRLPKVYGSQNPFPWMSEVIDLKKEKNFFETTVNEYQTGANLDW